MGKTFIEFLKEQDKDELVYVGTVNGSNWIVIETAQTIIENMDKIEKILYRHAVNTVERAQKNLDDIPAKLVCIQNKLKECKDEKDRKTLKMVKRDHERKFAASFKTRNDFEKILKAWRTLENRKVLDIYEQNIEDHGTAVILEGSDNGTLWFKGEKKVF